MDDVGDNHNDVDQSEVTSEELERAHALIRDHLSTRFATFRRAFMMLDENRSGKLTQLEMMRIPMMLNLTQVREKVFKRLVYIADKNEDGVVEFNEFCELMMADHALPLLKRHEKKQ